MKLKIRIIFLSDLGLSGNIEQVGKMEDTVLKINLEKFIIKLFLEDFILRCRCREL